jgi:nitroreductase
MIDKVMAARRSVRRFTPERPPRALLERLLEAAVTAPSASNKQPWRFVVVTSPARIAALAAEVREAVELIARHVEPRSESAFRAYGTYFTRFEAAPVVIVALYRSLTVLSDLVDGALPAPARARIAAMEERSGLIGVSMALQNLLLMAHELGLGASGMTGPLVAADRLRTLLEVPPSWEIAALVPVGYPAETPPAPARKPAARVTEWLEDEA